MHRAGDRHFDAVLRCQGQNRFGRVDTLGQFAVAGVRRVHALADAIPQREIARLQAGAGQRQIAHARQPHQRFRPRAQPRRQPRDFGKAACHQRRARILAQPCAGHDAARDGDDVFQRAS